MKSSSGTRAEFQPIEGFSAAEKRKVRAVLTDIDDTLTESGGFPPLPIRPLRTFTKRG